MKRKHPARPVIGIVALTVFLLSFVFVKEYRPLLGLDLQGGLSVVLAPTEEVSQDNLEVAIGIIRSRIDAIGVAEPEITTQDQNILVQIPGVQDADQALELVGTTAEVRFRPVLANLPPEADTGETTGTTPGSTPEGTTGDAGTTVPVDATVPADTTQEQGMAPFDGESAAGLQETGPTVAETTPPPSVEPAPDAGASDPLATTSSLDPAVQQQLEQPIQAQAQGQAAADPNLPTTPPDQDVPEATVVLPEYDKPPGSGDRTVVQRYQLGPVLLTGDALAGATAVINAQGEWTVNPRFKPGAEGIDQFNAAAAQCKPPSATCPTGQLAITLDGAVISAPQIQPQQQAFAPFQADQITISGNFDEQSARNLALVLNYGALPVALEVQQVQSVSATLGADALHAAVVSGVVALIAVVLYMYAFYRLLGLLAAVKLLLELGMLWAIISILGSTQGLALTLAGVTGIIVSIGVSVDSNVVYYEHLKEDIRKGRTRRSAVDKAFDSSFSTILKADGTSIIGAALLFFLTVGPVRGFAFFLGLSTVLDIFASWFFMRPAVAMAVKSKLCERRPTLFGLPRSDESRAVGREAGRRTPVTAGVAAGRGADGPGAGPDDGAVV